MVAVVETHDSTGFGESGGAVHPDEAVDFWVSMRDVLAGHEDDVIVNIANEPFGNQNTGMFRTVFAFSDCYHPRDKFFIAFSGSNIRQILLFLSCADPRSGSQK